MNLKTCIRCKEQKELVDFYKNRARRDGIDGYCKACKKWLTKYKPSPSQVKKRTDWFMRGITPNDY